MSFKNHGPGGCCCGGCCEIWSKIAQRRNQAAPTIVNQLSTLHPLHYRSTDNDWTFESSTGGLWDRAICRAGGSSRGWVFPLTGYYKNWNPASWSLHMGGSLEFKLKVSESPGCFGVFIGGYAYNSAYWPYSYAYENSAGKSMYFEFTDNGLFVTPISRFAGETDNRERIPTTLRSFSQGHGNRLPNPSGVVPGFFQGTWQYTDNINGCAGTSHDANGHRLQIPDYDNSNIVDVRIEFNGRHGTGKYWGQWYVNDYHIANFVDSERTLTYIGFTAGWGIGLASDAAEAQQDYLDSQYPGRTWRSVLGNHYEGQGFVTPSENCVYSVLDTTFCYNAMTDRLIEQTHPRPAYNQTSYGPSKATGCPEGPDFEAFGVNVTEQQDYVEEGFDGPWKKSTLGYSNPNHRPTFKTFSTNANGGSGSPTYFADSPGGFAPGNDGMFARANTWNVQPKTSSGYSKSFTLAGNPYISYLYRVSALIDGTKERVVVYGYFEYDGELAPIGTIASGEWRMHLERSLHTLNAQENYTFGESGSKYVYQLVAEAYKSGGGQEYNLDFTQVLYDEIWGSSWEFSVSVT